MGVVLAWAAHLHATNMYTFLIGWYCDVLLYRGASVDVTGLYRHSKRFVTSDFLCNPDPVGGNMLGLHFGENTGEIYNVGSQITVLVFFLQWLKST